MANQQADKLRLLSETTWCTYLEINVADDRLMIYWMIQFNILMKDILMV